MKKKKFLKVIADHRHLYNKSHQCERAYLRLTEIFFFFYYRQVLCCQPALAAVRSEYFVISGAVSVCLHNPRPSPFFLFPSKQPKFQSLPFLFFSPPSPIKASLWVCTFYNLNVLFEFSDCSVLVPAYRCRCARAGARLWYSQHVCLFRLFIVTISLC
jgi:hypothetical protein